MTFDIQTITRLGSLAFAAVLGACATIPEPPANAAPPLTLAERAGLPGVLHSDTIEAAGEATFASGPIADGDAIISFPFRYRHTAVLTEDVIGFSITVSGVQAPAGAPGYYAGTFVAIGGPVNASGDLWCFLPGVVGGERENLCLLRTSPAVAAIAPTRLNPYLWSQFSPATGSFDYVNAPVFERRAVEIPVDLTAEYRFDGWGRGVVRLEEYAVGEKVRDFTVSTDERGAYTLRTVAGDVTLARDPADPDRAVVSFAPR
ncbi:hypothetical protein [Terricaulis sp.]|uniref:hypothetical protein n=1 Tax=Terricaulis sp. TaxID=2768686 RepID=UPI002AC37D4F|nr:hypothetical protein [Terricaulis sp.]MDZ4693361.1 hypothetical protein [Terricaulis sp.]